MNLSSACLYLTPSPVGGRRGWGQAAHRHIAEEPTMPAQAAPVFTVEAACQDSVCLTF
jgi:hypothetical protein